VKPVCCNTPRQNYLIDEYINQKGAKCDKASVEMERVLANLIRERDSKMISQPMTATSLHAQTLRMGAKGGSRACIARRAMREPTYSADDSA
jgi:hypothetical protein